MSPAPPTTDWYCRRCGYPADLARERCPECGTSQPPRSNEETRDLIATSALPAWVLMGIGTVVWTILGVMAVGAADETPLWAVGCGLAAVPVTVFCVAFVAWNKLRKGKCLFGWRLATIMAIPYLTLVPFLSPCLCFLPVG